MLQCFGSPRGQPRTARISNPASSRSVFARRCSRDTWDARRVDHIRLDFELATSRPARSRSRSASNASIIRLIRRPALIASSRYRNSNPRSASGSDRSFFNGCRVR
jgi:hypothetical protein